MSSGSPQGDRSRSSPGLAVLPAEIELRIDCETDRRRIRSFRAECQRLNGKKEVPMEQRIYYGEVLPAELAGHLVQQYDPQPDLQAQQLGEGDSLLVQIGRGDQPEKLSHAVTVAITRAPEGASGLVVTMGQQQWLTPSMAGYAAMMGLISVLVTPWALFALIWPISHMLGSATLPGDIWNSIDLYMASRGASRGPDQPLAHPHAG
jgi:hypothetical protein